MALNNFGRIINLEVYSKSGDEITVHLPAKGLRVDFDINNTAGYKRARFDVYNLNQNTIKEVSSGEKFIRMSTSLHGSRPYMVANNYYVSNVYTETKLPNSITSFFCMSGLRRQFLEKQVSVVFTQGTLEEFVKKLVSASGESGIEVKLRFFPDTLEELKTVTGKVTRFSGSIEQHLIRLGDMYHFEYYIEDNDLILAYRVDNPTTYNSSGLKESTFNIIYDVNQIKSNPVVGAGTIQIESTLFPELVPGYTVDTNNMLTASTNLSEETLRTASGALKANVGDFSIYQIYNVIHKGSNYTDAWNTIALGVTADRGNRMSANSFNWYGRN